VLAGNVGDRVVVESERVGRAPREGEILEVLDAGESVHYRVRWEDGHESEIFPSVGSVTIVPKTKRAVKP
jgi:hypothetical protein